MITFTKDTGVLLNGGSLKPGLILGKRADSLERSGSVQAVLIVLTLLAFSFNASAQQADSTKLQSYLKVAAQNNPALQTAYYHYLAARQQSPQAGALPNPKVTFGYIVAPAEMRQPTEIAVMQHFPWFGTLGARSDAADFKSKAQFAKFKNKRNQLFYKIKKKWYSLYIINKKIGITQKNIEILKSLLNLTRQKYETGSGTQASILRAQIRLQDLKVNKQSLLDDKEVLADEFNELLGTDYKKIDTPSKLKPVQLQKSKSQLIHYILQNNPSLDKLDYKKHSAEQLVNAARLSGYPSFSIGASYMFMGGGSMIMNPNMDQNTFMFQISVDIPLFRAKYKAKKKQAMLQKKSIQYQKHAVQNKLTTAVESAIHNFRKAKRNYELYAGSQIKRSRQALDILRESYATGKSDFENVLQLQQKLLDFNFAEQKALGKMHIAQARIEFLYGKYNLTEFK